MKRLLLMLMILLMLLVPMCSFAQADADAIGECYVSLSELSEQAMAGWHETYFANGREVTAKVTIDWMPDAKACPILEVEQMEMNIDEQVLAKFRGKGNTVDVSKQWHNLFIEVDAQKRNWFVNGHSGSDSCDWDEDEFVFHHGEQPTVQPEGLDCTYQELFDFIDGVFTELTGIGLDAYWTEELTAGNVIWSCKERDGQRIRVEPVSKCGSWSWCGWQTFHGIPMRVSFADGPFGYAVFNFYGADTYDLSQSPVVETGILYKDVPLLSFESMKKVWKEQIEVGNLRGVDELQFGYIAFRQKDAQGERWVLQPVWVLTGGYTEDVSKEQVMPYHDAQDAGDLLTVPEEYRQYYYNAQTGEMVHVPKERKALTAYQVLTWKDVGIAEK